MVNIIIISLYLIDSSDDDNAKVGNGSKPPIEGASDYHGSMGNEDHPTDMSSNTKTDDCSSDNPQPSSSSGAQISPPQHMLRKRGKH